MNSLIAFDLKNDPNDEVKAALIHAGYFNRWTGNGVIYNLPKCTLWKPNTILADAKVDVTSIVNALNQGRQNQIVVSRLIIVPVAPWDGIPGEPLLP